MPPACPANNLAQRVVMLLRFVAGHWLLRIAAALSFAGQHAAVAASTSGERGIQCRCCQRRRGEGPAVRCCITDLIGMQQLRLRHHQHITSRGRSSGRLGRVCRRSSGRRAQPSTTRTRSRPCLEWAPTLHSCTAMAARSREWGRARRTGAACIRLRQGKLGTPVVSACGEMLNSNELSNIWNGVRSPRSAHRR